MFVTATDLGNALDAMFSDPYFPENEEPTETASTEDPDKAIKEMFGEIVEICKSISLDIPATNETVSWINGLFQDISDLKDMVEKAAAERNESTNAVAEESTQPEQKSKPEIIEARVTGEGPVTPMM